MKFIKDLFTEANGESWCPIRVGMGVGVAVFIGLSFYSVYGGHEFKPTEWGMGYGSLILGGGGGIWGKKGVE